MELIDAVKGRRSVRKFKKLSIPKEDIDKIMESAIWAPSGSNRQQWRFIIVTDDTLKNKLANAIEDVVKEMEKELGDDSEIISRLKKSLPYYTFFREAPVLIVAIDEEVPSTSSRVMEMRTNYKCPISIVGLSSVAAAIQNLLLTAHSLGYGTCWMTGPLIAKKEMEQILGIEYPQHLVALIPLGIPAESPQPKQRIEGRVEYR
ncbi:MAG: hypothetical protein B6D57_02260 [Candidatus Coatesbacteria bacterium 4484_99]|uniref:Nitroreductase domain-containing protein n=1 Tax=Candidatus Coatesbacteria bacterium 4484_99 TaxID=1970774 RepID=A0A1W9S1H9_9BACT|nr:MAG: hypothetical protein B6D57_02260 [Candidatus Coatesbacteria bacterium 4484_99]HEC79931.1 nitroreductase family protein [Bacillota bacterium]